MVPPPKEQQTLAMPRSQTLLLGVSIPAPSPQANARPGEGLSIPEGSNFPVTQREQKGPNFPTWGNLAADQGLFRLPGEEHPPRPRWLARNHPLEAKFTRSHGGEASILKEKRAEGGNFPPPWGHHGPILVVGWAREWCPASPQRGCRTRWMLVGCKNHLEILPQCKRRPGKVTLSRVVPRGSAGQGATPVTLRKVSPSLFPHVAEARCVGGCGPCLAAAVGKEVFGPGPNPQGGGKVIARHGWGQRWPLVTSSSCSALDGKVQPPFRSP